MVRSWMYLLAASVQGTSGPQAPVVLLSPPWPKAGSVFKSFPIKCCAGRSACVCVCGRWSMGVLCRLPQLPGSTPSCSDSTADCSSRGTWGSWARCASSLGPPGGREQTCPRSCPHLGQSPPRSLLETETVETRAMEESPDGGPEAWGPSGGWPAPRKARGGPSLSSVLNELPSAATLRYRGPGALPWGRPEEEDGGRSSQAFAEAAQNELQEARLLRELPWPMQARRAHRQSHASDQAAQVSGSTVAHWARRLRRSKEKMREGLRSLQPWAWTLKRIGGQFGAGTESYFLLLRFLLLLNVLAAGINACMMLLPTWLEGAPPGPPGSGNSSHCGFYNPHPQGLLSFSTQLFNLLSGEGYMEWSPLFYGFYPPRQTLALTYLCSVFAIGLLCLLLILHRSVSGMKQTLLAESGTLTSYSHRVFSAWDFGLGGDEHVRLRQRLILYELRVELEEAVVRRRAAVRTLGQQAWVWSLRLLLNLLVVALLGAAFYGVYWATRYTVELQEKPFVQQMPLIKLGVDYLPSIFIFAVNFFLPPVFNLIAPLEGYTRSCQIAFILLRTVFLRLASLVVLLLSLWDKITCGGDAEAAKCKVCGYNYKELPADL
ncbi:transmembrane channel-like protein 4 isoform X2 [Choloepus didactylus]|uniref:transmembrane channel-like protein 4 isoform X2 n=1 Tax=Choloepus didactylus TaxID=27675 RepID=UPI00189D221E|nr:transmembrane channel-like protein 4 isoform X2 [Choloepus didactylus]